MPLINDAIFHAEWKNNPNFRSIVGDWLTYYNNHNPMSVTADRPSALSAQQLIRNVLVDRQRSMNKSMRPWELTPKVFEALNRAEPWWGWEFETGWQNAAARGQALAFTYDNIDGVMYDGEGEGGWPVEITFIPQERSKFLKGESDAHKFVQWMSDNSHLPYLGDNNDVGTHLNMSHPDVDSQEVTHRLATFLNRTLWHTIKVNGQRKLMFGRESIYAGFFAQRAGDANWVEFKGYRTAYDIESFNRYIKSAEAFQKCVDLFVTQDMVGKAVTNLYDVAFNGAEPEVVVWDGPPLYPANAARLHTRYTMGPY